MLVGAEPTPPPELPPFQIVGELIQAGTGVDNATTITYRVTPEELKGFMLTFYQKRLLTVSELPPATMRSHEALLRVCDLLEAWKITIQNRNGITWNQMDAGDTLRLRKSIDELEAAISPPNVKHPQTNED